MELVLPSVVYKDSFIEAVKEFQAVPAKDRRSALYSDLSIAELERDFGSFIEKDERYARGEGLPKGYVPMTTYWLVDQGEFIGRVSIRHRLNEHLTLVGGHIGYEIRPSKRHSGFGTLILQMALPKARELGIDRVLLTCDVDNTGSRKIIEKNGGIFENEVAEETTGLHKLRFWITLAEKPVIRKAAGILIKDRQLLVTRSTGKSFFVAPGGKIEAGETAPEALCRELTEELGIEVSPGSIRLFGNFSALATGLTDTQLQMDVFRVDAWQGDIRPMHEVEEIRWVDSVTSQNIELGSIFQHEVIPRLTAEGLIG